MHDRPASFDPTQFARQRMPRWLAWAASMMGAALGVLANLYSSEFRGALENAAGGLDFTVVSIFMTAIVASGSTAVAYRWLSRRRQRMPVHRGEIRINTDALGFVTSDHDLVVGRSLHYLEAKRDSAELVVFLHGLGLDANDFRPYMVESRFHCIAVTLYGFNTHERDDERYAPISLESHVQLLAYALTRLHREYPRKRMTLAGFSFGADNILFLGQFAPGALRDLNVHRAVLLDPNVNRETTTISSKIAQVDENHPLDQMVRLLESAASVQDYRYLCEYMYKITAKNFAQVRRHATDVVAVWSDRSNDRFLDYLGQLTTMTHGAHVTLSFTHGGMFNELARSATARGLDANNLECSSNDHFELLDPGFLKDRIEGLI